jgi:hypothetical protein
MGYASLGFWSSTLIDHYHSNEQLVIAFLVGCGVLPFITAGMAKHAFQEGQILKGYLVSAVTSVPVAAILVYVTGALIVEMLFHLYGIMAGIAYYIWASV